MTEWKETDFGKVPINWEISTLGNICQLLTDGSHVSPKPVLSDYFMASVKDMRYNHFDFNDCKTVSKIDFDLLIKNNCSPQIGDILLSKDGANCLDIIFVYKQKEKIVLLSSIAIARLKQGHNPDFYRYFLLSPNVQEVMRNNFVSGSAIPRVILKDFRNVPVPLIHSTEQNAIAEILCSLDDKIDLLHRQNRTLEQLAETLFRQWFVEEAEESWETKRVKDVCTTISKGTTPTTLGKQFRESGINFIKAESLTDTGGFLPEKFAFIDEDTDELLKRSRIQKGDILITIAGTIGRIAYVTIDVLPANTNQAIGFMRANKEVITPHFIYCLFKTSEIRNDFEGRVVHAVQPNLSLGEIGNIEFKMPPQEILKKGMKELETLFDKKEKNTNQIHTLTQLRDTLLPKLMSGEVRVN